MTSAFVRRIAVMLALFTTTVRAQSGLESAVKQYSAASVEGYIQPLADVLVATLSLGYVTTTSPSKLSFGFELVSMTSTIDDKLRVYTANSPPGFTPSTIQAPTIFGGTAPTVNHSTIPGLTYRGADGLMTGQYFPSAAPQLRVGGFFGTEVAVRYISSSMVPLLDEDKFPTLTLFGLGVQHSLSRYVPLPVDVSIAASFNSLTFGDIVDLRSNTIGFNVGRSLGLVAVSFGVLSESGTMNLKYTSSDPQVGTVDVDLDVSRTMRFRGGASASLGFLKVFGDAAFGDVISYAAGLRFGF